MFKSVSLVVVTLGLAFLVDMARATYSPCCLRRRDLLEEEKLFAPGQFDEDARLEYHEEQRRLGCSCNGVLVDSIDDCCCEDDFRVRGLKVEKGSKAPKSCKSDKSANDDTRRRLPASISHRRDDHAWVSPASDKAELLAADPGIWAIPEFLDDELVDKFKALIDRLGNNLGHFGGCSIVNPVEKKCLKLNSTLSAMNEEDHEVFSEIRAKVQSLWPQFNLREYLHVQENPEGELDPTDYHFDGTKFENEPSSYFVPSTVLIYLSDSDENYGGKTIFPYAGNDGLAVSPRKGMALTWLNLHADGEIKEKSLHGVQASTASSRERLIATQKFFLLPEERLDMAGDEAKSD